MIIESTMESQANVSEVVSSDSDSEISYSTLSSRVSAIFSDSDDTHSASEYDDSTSNSSHYSSSSWSSDSLVSDKTRSPSRSVSPPMRQSATVVPCEYVEYHAYLCPVLGALRVSYDQCVVCENPYMG